jgi:beta-N-acetylhexosaminidase
VTTHVAFVILPKRHEHLQSLGPLLIDVAGLELTERGTRAPLPSAGGRVILFARNYRDPDQLTRCAPISMPCAVPPLPIAIDHEGGRVQRCREGFTRLPPMRRLGRPVGHRPQAPRWKRHISRASSSPAELRACGVDFSFTPVLDLDYGRSQRDRPARFPRRARCRGAPRQRAHRRAARSGHGLPVASTFPGHGWVEADSHLSPFPVDERSWDELQPDLIEPYRQPAA